MKLNPLLIGALLLLLCPTIKLSAQEKTPVKFGKITPQDFDLSGHTFDTSVTAVIIADVGSTSFEGNSKGSFTLIFKRQKRIKILNKNGFDAATHEINLYHEGQEEEELKNLKASSYNLENGNVVETKLDSKDIFKVKESANWQSRKFTLPAVKAGTIIEYSYTIASDFFFNLQPWVFQDEYPCLWSEYQLGLPEFFNYVYLAQGYQSFHIKTKSESFRNYTVVQQSASAGGSSSNITISARVSDQRWVMKDVPAIREEAYTSSIKNHISKIEFQLSQIRFPGIPVKDVMGNWYTVSDKLLESEDFGSPIQKVNSWLGDDLRAIVGASKDPEEKAKKIFAYVRDNFTCTSYSGTTLSDNLRSILKAKKGTVADLNLLLIAMLRHEDIICDPVLLSTRSHGFAHEMYPLLNRFNYVIADVQINGTTVYLDASRPLGFGKLSEDCYNGAARVISKQPTPIYFDADSLKERKFTTVFIVNNEKGEVDGSFTSALGFAESATLRKRIRESSKSSEFKKIQAQYGDSYTISSEKIDSLDLLEEPVAVHYNFQFKKTDEDLIYFNPLLSEGYKENIFKSADRKYPVEMPFVINETFILNMDVPQHYDIDELPKSAKVDFNSGEGFFEYIIGKTSAGAIQLRSRVVLNKANFTPEDYSSLREFFGYIVKKHSEPIVFKKKS